MIAGDLKFLDWDWSAGEAEFQRAVELDPGSVQSVHHYAVCLHAQARWDAALREYRRALELDPVSTRLNVQFLAFLTDAGRYKEASDQFKRVIELDPNNAPAYRRAGILYELQGREDEALAAYLKAEGLGGRSAEQLRSLEDAGRTAGLRGFWNKHLGMLKDRAKKSRVPPFDFATLYVRTGDKDKAMEMLEAAYQQRAPRLAWIRAEAVFEPLRSDPRFQFLLRRMRFPE